MSQAVVREDVFSVAEELVASGVKATNQAVRDALGRGSYTTISSFLKEWRKQMDSEAQANVEPLPEKLGAKLHSMGQSVWQIAIETASGRFDTERLALEKRCSEAEAEVSEAVALADSLAEIRDVLMSEVRESKAELASVRKELTKKSDQLATARARAESAEVKAERLECHVDDLRSEVTRLSGQVAELIAALAKPRDDE